MAGMRAGPAESCRARFFCCTIARVQANDAQLLDDAGRQCRRLLEELGRYRRELSSSPGRLAPEATAAGVACVDAAIAAARNVLAGFEHDDRHP
jgi:hypothetical protein